MAVNRPTKTGIDDYHHLDFDPVALVDVLQECMQRVPGCTVGRSGNGTGNLCVYDKDGVYVGVIELNRGLEEADFLIDVLFGDDETD